MNIIHNVKNQGPVAVLVVMDDDREMELIYPGKEETFQEANVGNRPTFRVFMDKKEVYKKEIGLLVSPFGRKKLIWTGEEPVDD